jgi:carbon-monoxide dehydrogenase medium subunit
MSIPSFDYSEPKQLSEAVSLLAGHDSDAALLAGGTDLLIMLRAGITKPKLVINLKQIPGLAGVNAENGGIRVGALTLIRSIETSALIRERLPALGEAAGCLGSLQIRHLATIGGNLCRAAPCAETAPPLLVYNALVCLVGPDGERAIPVGEFFTGPGQTNLTRGEVLTEIHIPQTPPRSGAAYLRHSVRPIMDLAIVNVAAFVALDGAGQSITDSRIVLGSVAPTPIRAIRAEQALNGQPISPAILDGAAKLAAEESQPISDVRSTDEYRRSMVRLFTRRALEKAVARATGET